MLDKELRNCTFSKTVLMMCICFYHSIIFWTGNWLIIKPVYAAPVLAWFSKWLNSFHVYAFTFISGYIFYYKKYEKHGYGKFLPFIYTKFKRLIVPYIFFSICWVIPFGVYLFDWNYTTIHDSFILGKNPSQLWFLLMLFWVFVVFWILSNFAEKHTLLSGITIVGIWVVNYFVLSKYIPDLYMILTSGRYLLVFWVGFKTRQFGSKWIRKVNVLTWAVLDVFLFVLYRYLGTHGTFVLNLLSLGVELCCNICGACMAFAILQKIADTYESNRIIQCLSRYSMTIYMLHQQIIYIMIYLLNGIVNPYVHSLVNFAVSLTAALGISVILGKIRITRFLIGEK